MSIPRTIDPVLVIALLIGLVGSGNARADVARGAALAEQWCSQCHGIRPNAPSANPKAPNFSAIAAEPSATEYSLRIFLRTPHETMPNFILKSDDIDDLVAYLRSLKTKD
jgi:cytochrome c